MGEVLQLRLPQKKLDRDDVILVPRETNTEASRDVVANPQNFSDSVLRAACIWLRDNGDWMDQERARHLLKTMDRDARLKAADDAWWEAERRFFKLVALFSALLIIGIAIFDHAWGQSLAAGVAQ